MANQPSNTTLGTEAVIYACRTPYAAEVAETLYRLGTRLITFVDNLPDGPVAISHGTAISPSSLETRHLALPVFIPQLTPAHRHAISIEASGLGFTKFATIIDPSSVVAESAGIGPGTVVNAGSIVGANAKIGSFCHLNRGASVAHDAQIASFVSLGPGCVLSGSVTLDSGAFIGSGAVLAPGVHVGRNAIVGAGAVVVRAVEPNTVVVGNPARVLGDPVAGYGDVGISDNVA